MDEALDLFGLREEDRRDYQRLLATASDRTEVDTALHRLRSRRGTYPSGPPPAGLSEEAWLRAFAEDCAALVDWQRHYGVSDEVITNTLADVGRQIALNRVVQGRFGLENWWWITAHFAGGLYQLGRLQFMLRRMEAPAAPPGFANEDWLLDVHIPQAGRLAPGAVADSFTHAPAFFAHCFPHHPVRVASCSSWLLDPFLADHLPADSNIVRFQACFTPYGEVTDAQADAVYFTFQTRDLNALHQLPRDTTLQRVVLDRIAAGGTWKVARGYRAV